MHLPSAWNTATDKKGIPADIGAGEDKYKYATA